MAKILLLETATEVCSVALAIDGVPVCLKEDPPPAKHAANLTLLIQDCLREAGLIVRGIDAVAVSNGPGSYTGLRVGAAAAKGICFILNKPLIAVDTLQALAAASIDALEPDSRPGCLFLPMLDARRQEVWTASFDHHGRRLSEADMLIFEDNLFESFLRTIPGFFPGTRFVLSGNGAAKALSGSTGERVVGSAISACSAAFLAGLAEAKFQKSDFEDISYYEPFYMKPPNITLPKNL